MARTIRLRPAPQPTAYVVRHNAPDAVAAYVNINCGSEATLGDAVALANALVGAGVALTARVVTRHDWDNALHVARAGL